MNEDDLDHHPTERKMRAPGYSPEETLVDTGKIKISTPMLFRLTCHEPDRVALTLYLAYLVWARQRRLPASIEGWSNAEIVGVFGPNRTRVLKRLYSQDLLDDVNALTRGRAPLAEGAREAIFAASGGKCAHCSEDITFDDFHVDHLKPVARGGLGTGDNLVASCPPCNRRKGAR